MHLRWVRFESAALGGAACEVKALEGEDELNCLFEYRVRLVVPDVAVATELARELLLRPGPAR